MTGLYHPPEWVDTVMENAGFTPLCGNRTSLTYEKTWFWVELTEPTTRDGVCVKVTHDPWSDGHKNTRFFGIVETPDVLITTLYAVGVGRIGGELEGKPE